MNYTLQSHDLDKIARIGSGKIEYSVVGWKDTNIVKIDIERNPRIEGKYPWSIKVEKTTYVYRDETAVADQLIAAENVAEAMLAAVKYAREIRKQYHRLDSLYQEAEAVRQVEKARRDAEAKAAYDADTPVGMKLAKHITQQMAAEIKTKNSGSWDEIAIQFASRGERKQETLSVRFSYRGLILFSMGHWRVSRDKALTLIADSSIDCLKVDNINVVDPKFAKFMMI